jgi:dihydrodipicolinate synthase/N-acetylneuraminate lyase
MIGKGTRLGAHVQSQEYLSRHAIASTATGQFQVLPGFSESLLPSLIGRHTGCITGTGNVFPKTMQRLYTQALKGIAGDAAALAEAAALQDRVARSDFIIVKAGIQGTKHALDHFVQKGLGGVSRSPLGPVTPEIAKMVEEQLKEDWEFECSL